VGEQPLEMASVLLRVREKPNGAAALGARFAKMAFSRDAHQRSGAHLMARHASHCERLLLPGKRHVPANRNERFEISFRDR
jgi:hypothetical protein